MINDDKLTIFNKWIWDSEDSLEAAERWNVCLSTEHTTAQGRGLGLAGQQAILVGEQRQHGQRVKST